MPAEATVNGPMFDEIVTLREAYKIMLRFVHAYHERGDTTVSDFLFVYSDLAADGRSADPAAIDDFLAAAREILQGRRT